MPLIFPTSPTTGQIFTSGGMSWQFDGFKWTAAPGSAPGGTLTVTDGTTTVPNTTRVTFAGNATVGGTTPNAVVTVTGGGGGGGSDYVNIKTVYGAVGDGSTDDTAAIMAMIAGVSPGVTVFWPAGNYKVTAAITVGKTMTWLGAGRLATTISTNQATTNLFTFNVTVNISEIGFNCSVTATSGFMLTYNAGAARSRLERFWMVNFFNGIVLEDPAADICLIDGQMFNWQPTGTAIRLNGGLSVLLDAIIMQQGVAPGNGNGIMITNGGPTINNCQILACGTCLNLMPASGQAVVSVWCMNTGFDSAANGIVFQPQGSGGIARNWFVGCWMGGQTQSGVTMISSGAGSINGTEFNNCHVFGNQLFGFNITDNQTLNTSWINCEIAGNGQEGISYFAGGQRFSIQDCIISDTGGFGINTAGAINLGGPCSYYRIVNNDLTNGGVNPLVGSGVNTGTAPGANEFIMGNVGYFSQNRGGASITAGQTSVTVNHGLSGTPLLTDILLTCLTGMGNPPQAIPFVISPNSSTFVIEIGIPLGFTTAFSWWAKLACNG